MQLIISIHALREEGDDDHPARGTDRRYFYPRPPRGGRLWRRIYHTSVENFYPRPPQGGRHLERLTDAVNGIFLSTPSARRATNSEYDAFVDHHISIHALRKEGDHSKKRKELHNHGISIHALRKEGDPSLTA